MFITAASERSPNRVPAQIDLSIARSRSDLQSAFELVYTSYVKAGLQERNDQGMRLTRHHFQPTTEVIVAKKDGQTISTATLIIDSECGLPSESMYASEIGALRKRGLRIAEVSCLADRRESPARFIHMFRKLTRLVAQAAAVRGCNALIAATHPRHSRFYMRQLGFEQFGDIRECPFVQGNPAVALVLDFEQHVNTPIHDHLFGQKYSAAELAPFEWDNATRNYFLSIFQRLRQRSTNRGDGSLKPITTATPSPIGLSTQ